MAIAKLREGDTVVVLAGKDRGQVGEIIKIRGEKAKISGVNLVSKCHKRNPQSDEQGGIRKQEAFLDCSNVALWNATQKRKICVGIKTLDSGKRIRFDKRSGEVIEETRGQV